MQYYKLNLSTDSKVIGRRVPQIYDLVNSEKYDRSSGRSIYNVNCWKKITSDLDIPEFRLHGHAKRTDVVSGVNCFLMISKRLKELLEVYNLPQKQIFKTSLFNKSDKHEYYLFYLFENLYKFIDFKKSTFALIHSLGRPVLNEKIEINSLIEFEQKVGEYPYLIKNNPHRLKVVVENLVLDTDKIPFDLFRIIGPISSHSYFISEKLKNAIEEQKLSGWEFLPLNKIKSILPPN